MGRLPGILRQIGARKIEKEVWLPKEVYQNRKMVLTLAKNDFKTKYAGSYFRNCMGVCPADRNDLCLLVCVRAGASQRLG